MHDKLVTSPTGGTGPMIMEVASGKLIDLTKFCKEDVELHDIASSLAKQCRFGGHCDRFYSVAEHAVRVCRAILDSDPGAFNLAAWGLHHDDSEAYLGDVIRPLKTDSYRETEDKIMGIIADRFNLWGRNIPATVKHFDNVLVHTEGLYIMANQTRDWPKREEMAPPLPLDKFDVVGWPPAVAYKFYMATHNMLEEKRNVCL